MISIFLGLLTIGISPGLVFGECLYTVQVKNGFDANQYLGKWYESEKYNSSFETGVKCIHETYRLNTNGTIGIAGAHTSSSTGEVTIYNGNGTQGIQEKAKWAVLLQYPTTQVEGPYWILDTDYISYAVVWSCLNNEQIVWVMTRNQNPTVDVLQKGHDVLTKNGLDVELLTTTDQSNCPDDL